MQSCYYKESDQNTHTRRNREESLAREMSAEMFEMMMMCGGEQKEGNKTSTSSQKRKDTV